MTKLIAQMVVRNEADRYLTKVLEDLLLYVDEIVITDDCSDDSTLAIATNYTDLAYQTSEHLFVKDEGKLRQEALQNLSYTAKTGDWILAIDADEIIWSTKRSIHHILTVAQYDVIGLEFINMWNDTQYRVDKFWAPMTCTKLFRFKEDGKIQDKKLACGSEPTYVADEIRKGRWHQNVGLKIQHWGYARDEDKITKYNRYMEIDGGKYHSGAHLASIMDKEPKLVTWDFERII
jgi:glycosyltransferase involved in cell wall biosynthesis